MQVLQLRKRIQCLAQLSTRAKYFPVSHFITALRFLGAVQKNCLVTEGYSECCLCDSKLSYMAELGVTQHCIASSAETRAHNSCVCKLRSALLAKEPHVKEGANNTQNR